VSFCFTFVCFGFAGCFCFTCLLSIHLFPFVSLLCFCFTCLLSFHLFAFVSLVSFRFTYLFLFHMFAFVSLVCFRFTYLLSFRLVAFVSLVCFRFSAMGCRGFLQQTCLSMGACVMSRFVCFRNLPPPCFRLHRPVVISFESLLPSYRR
jgi:hypothetical protein